MLGNSRHCAPVPSTHSTPFKTARVSCHGRPRLSPRREGRSTGSNIAHCSSVTSQRPCIGQLQSTPENPIMPLLTPNCTRILSQPIYETGSRVLFDIKVYLHRSIWEAL